MLRTLLSQYMATDISCPPTNQSSHTRHRRHRKGRRMHFSLTWHVAHLPLSKKSWKTIGDERCDNAFKVQGDANFTVSHSIKCCIQVWMGNILCEYHIISSNEYCQNEHVLYLHSKLCFATLYAVAVNILWHDWPTRWSLAKLRCCRWSHLVHLCSRPPSKVEVGSLGKTSTIIRKDLTNKLQYHISDCLFYDSKSNDTSIMPGHIKLGKSGEPDPDPMPYLVVSMEMKREDLRKPYDPKKSVWVPDERDGGFREGLLENDDGTKATVMLGHEVRDNVTR